MKVRPLLFSLIELLIVIAIFGVILSTLLPQLKKITDEARSIQCKQNLYSIIKGEVITAEDDDQVWMGEGFDYITGKLKMPSWYSSKHSLGANMDKTWFACPTDKFSNLDDLQDGVSYGRNQSDLFHAIKARTRVYWSGISHPNEKVFYGDSGHLQKHLPAEESERYAASKRIRAYSSAYIGPNPWNDRGLYPRHHKKSTSNVLFFDGHVETSFNLLETPNSLNGNKEKHWKLEY